MLPSNDKERQEMAILQLMDSTGNPFDLQQNRRAFIRRVYALMSVALTLTAVQLAVVLSNEDLLYWFAVNWWLAFIFMLGYMVCFMALVCCGEVRKRSPLNLILFAVIVECMTGMTIYVTARYRTHIVLGAFALTAGVCLVVTMIALFVPIDFTTKGLYLMVLGVVTMIVCLATLIVSLISPSYILQVVCSSIVVFTVSLYFAYDTQMIFGRKHFALDPDDVVYGALSLYVDVMILFQNILFLFGACEDC